MILVLFRFFFIIVVFLFEIFKPKSICPELPTSFLNFWKNEIFMKILHLNSPIQLRLLIYHSSLLTIILDGNTLKKYFKIKSLIFLYSVIILKWFWRIYQSKIFLSINILNYSRWFVTQRFFISNHYLLKKIFFLKITWASCFYSKKDKSIFIPNVVIKIDWNETYLWVFFT